MKPFSHLGDIFYNSNAQRVPIPLSAVVPTFDLGSPQPGHPQTPGAPGYALWIHQRNKTEVGRRLALALLRLGATAPSTVLTTQGPVVVTAFLSQAQILVNLTHADGLAMFPAGMITLSKDPCTVRARTSITRAVVTIPLTPHRNLLVLYGSHEQHIFRYTPHALHNAAILCDVIIN